MLLLNSINIRHLWGRNKLAFIWAFALFVLLISLAYIAMDVFRFNQTKTNNLAPQTIAPIQRSQGPSYRVNDIVNANLFGDPTPKVVVKNAPKTTLDLTLQGILWSSDGTMGRAIIQAGKKSPQLYSLGERIQGAGASVEEIRDTEILLNRNGAIESLPLVKTKSGGSPIISYDNTQNYEPVPIAAASTANPTISRTTPKPQSPNGKPRKVRKPNFSGLDRALRKMGEI